MPPSTSIYSALPHLISRRYRVFLSPKAHMHLRQRSTFTYRLAAASAAKSTPLRPAQLNRDYFLHTTTSIPSSEPYLRSTKECSGEDAFFATAIAPTSSPNSSQVQSHGVAFGVADGVGGWQDQGVDPSDFSHGLCGLMAGTANLWEGGTQTSSGKGTVKGKGKGKLRALDLLQGSFDAVMGNPRILAGGSTASLGVIDEFGAMEGVNLGDSSFLHLTPNKITFRSPIQTHAFNTPFQLSKIPAQLQTRQAIFGSQHFAEKPSQADVTQHTIRHGDIVVFATDGVWDNLSSGEVLSVIGKIMRDGGYWVSESGGGKETVLNAELISALPTEIQDGDEDSYLPGLLAVALMREAKAAGLDRRRNTPFAKEVKSRYPDEAWEGGKPDDIAVVVCVAVEQESKNDDASERGNGGDEEIIGTRAKAKL